MDKRTHLLLDTVSALCADGSFKIIEEDELLACFPPKLPVDRTGLGEMLGYLRENGYIDMRYAEEGVYCLTVLPAGRIYAERERAARTEHKRRLFGNFLMTALGALLGGFLGALFASLLSWGRV